MEALVYELRKYFLKYFGNFNSLHIFLESIHILKGQEDNLELDKKKKKLFRREGELWFLGVKTIFGDWFTVNILLIVATGFFKKFYACVQLLFFKIPK